MRPTEHGLRLTRKMADGIGRVMVRQEFGRGMSLSDEQQERLAGAIADRAWDMKMRYSRPGSTALEHFYGSVLEQEIARDERQLSPEQAQEFSEKVGPGARIVREFWEGLLDDARPILDDEQYSELESKANEALKMTRRFEEKMDRWSRGEVKENERIMDGFDEDDVAAEEGAKSKEYIRAERSARWRVNSLGPDTWRRYLDGAARIFKFEEDQKKDGETILREYTEQADAIMTREWKAKLLGNRVQEQLQRLCPEEPLEPWIYHLELEYKRMVHPVEELGRAFRCEVLDLATPEQRERMFEELRKIGTEHGMDSQELVAITNLFPEPQTQPEAD